MADRDWSSTGFIIFYSVAGSFGLCLSITYILCTYYWGCVGCYNVWYWYCGGKAYMKAQRHAKKRLREINNQTDEVELEEAPLLPEQPKLRVPVKKIVQIPVRYVHKPEDLRNPPRGVEPTISQSSLQNQSTPRNEPVLVDGIQPKVVQQVPRTEPKVEEIVELPGDERHPVGVRNVEMKEMAMNNERNLLSDDVATAPTFRVPLLKNSEVEGLDRDPSPATVPTMVPLPVKEVKKKKLPAIDSAVVKDTRVELKTPAPVTPVPVEVHSMDDDSDFEDDLEFLGDGFDEGNHSVRKKDDVTSDSSESDERRKQDVDVKDDDSVNSGSSDLDLES